MDYGLLYSYGLRDYGLQLNIREMDEIFNHFGKHDKPNFGPKFGPPENPFIIFRLILV